VKSARFFRLFSEYWWSTRQEIRLERAERGNVQQLPQLPWFSTTYFATVRRSYVGRRLRLHKARSGGQVRKFHKWRHPSETVSSTFALPLFRPPFLLVLHVGRVKRRSIQRCRKRRRRARLRSRSAAVTLANTSPAVPESLAEGLPGRAHPILFVLHYLTTSHCQFVASVVSQSAFISSSPSITNLLGQRYDVTVKHLGLFGLLLGATELTSLCAPIWARAQHRWHRASTKKNDDPFIKL